MSVFQQQGSKSDKKEEATGKMDSVPMTAGDPVATMAVASVAYSWYNFYVKGDRQAGIFTGLWAPTLLAAASYLQQKNIVRQLKQKNIVQKFKRGLSSF